MQKFVAYRAIPSELISALRDGGNEVYYFAETDQTISADDVVRKANAESYLLLTGDDSLAQSLASAKQVPTGIVHVESDGFQLQAVYRSLLQNLGALAGSFTTVSSKQIKIKALGAGA